MMNEDLTNMTSHCGQYRQTQTGERYAPSKPKGRRCQAPARSLATPRVTSSPRMGRSTWALVTRVDNSRPVDHQGSFPELEDQMCGFTSDFDAEMAGYSLPLIGFYTPSACHLLRPATRTKFSFMPP
jgi:hypothetical protein